MHGRILDTKKCNTFAAFSLQSLIKYLPHYLINSCNRFPVLSDEKLDIICKLSDVEVFSRANEIIISGVYEFGKDLEMGNGECKWVVGARGVAALEGIQRA